MVGAITVGAITVGRGACAWIGAVTIEVGLIVWRVSGLGGARSGRTIDSSLEVMIVRALRSGHRREQLPDDQPAAR